MRRGLTVALLGLAVLLAAGCGSSYGGGSGGTTAESSDADGAQRSIAGVKANDHGTKAVEDGGKTEVELDDFYFEPTVLEGKAGETVELELKNEGNTAHSFTIDAQGVDKVIEPGDETEVMVAIPKAGVVSFYCKFHKSSGMAGALAVTGADTGGTGGMTTDEDSGDDGY
jgi:plastocyanin